SLQPLERARGDRDVFGIVIDEIRHHAVDLRNRHDGATGFEPALDQLAGAGADHVARGFEWERRQALAVEHEIERVDEVGRGIDERAVEIEDDGGTFGHGAALSVYAPSRKIAAVLDSHTIPKRWGGISCGNSRAGRLSSPA